MTALSNADLSTSAGVNCLRRVFLSQVHPWQAEGSCDFLRREATVSRLCFNSSLLVRLKVGQSRRRLPIADLLSVGLAFR
jgi:hypothetical protein